MDGFFCFVFFLALRATKACRWLNGRFLLFWLHSQKLSPNEQCYMGDTVGFIQCLAESKVCSLYLTCGPSNRWVSSESQVDRSVRGWNKSITFSYVYGERGVQKAQEWIRKNDLTEWNSEMVLVHSWHMTSRCYYVWAHHCLLTRSYRKMFKRNCQLPEQRKAGLGEKRIWF